MWVSGLLRAEQLLHVLLHVVLREWYIWYRRLRPLASRPQRAAIPERDGNRGVESEKNHGEDFEADVSPVALYQVVFEAGREEVCPDEVSSIDDYHPGDLEHGQNHGGNEDPGLPSLGHWLKARESLVTVHLELLNGAEPLARLLKTVGGHVVV